MGTKVRHFIFFKDINNIFYALDFTFPFLIRFENYNRKRKKRKLQPQNKMLPYVFDFSKCFLQKYVTFPVTNACI